MQSSSNSDIRQTAKAAIDSLPSDSTWEDIFYTLHVRKKIEAGLEDAQNGETLSHDDVKQMLKQSQ